MKIVLDIVNGLRFNGGMNNQIVRVDGELQCRVWNPKSQEYDYRDLTDYEVYLYDESPRPSDFKCQNPDREIFNTP